MTKKVLLADDDESLRESLRANIQCDYPDVVIDCVENGRLLVEYAREERHRGGRYSLILTDHSMPEVNGLQAIKQIRAFDKEVPIYLVAAQPQEVLDNALSAGATGYVSKRKIRENLLPVLQQYLG